ncbi:hypothetical protein DFH27DRAFT_563518 [Peziza echinospora]|nr:hypothetical protein DFH27DRAFT_563518 [Peziza echinospora]
MRAPAHYALASYAGGHSYCQAAESAPPQALRGQMGRHKPFVYLSSAFGVRIGIATIPSLDDLPSAILPDIPHRGHIGHEPSQSCPLCRAFRACMQRSAFASTMYAPASGTVSMAPRVHWLGRFRRAGLSAFSFDITPGAKPSHPLHARVLPGGPVQSNARTRYTIPEAKAEHPTQRKPSAMQRIHLSRNRVWILPPAARSAKHGGAEGKGLACQRAGSAVASFYSGGRGPRLPELWNYTKLGIEPRAHPSAGTAPARVAVASTQGAGGIRVACLSLTPP